MVWYPINSQFRTEYIRQIKITTLELQDSIPLGELELHTEEIFTVVGAGERPYEFVDNVHLSISFEMSLCNVTFWFGFDVTSDLEHFYKFANAR